MLVIEHGGTDAGPFIQMPGALSYPMNMAATTGVSGPSPSRISAAAPRPPRGKVIGGRRRSTAWSMSAAMPATTTMGRDGAPRLGLCRCAALLRRMEDWHRGRRRRSGLARQTGRCTSRAGRGPTRCPCLRRGRPQAGYPLPTTTTASSRRASARWRRRSESPPLVGRQRLSAPGARTGQLRIIRAFARRIMIEEGRAPASRSARRPGREITARGARSILAASSINSPSC